MVFTQAISPFKETAQSHFPSGSSDKDPPATAEDAKDMSFDPWVRKIPWRRA